MSNYEQRPPLDASSPNSQVFEELTQNQQRQFELQMPSRGRAVTSLSSYTLESLQTVLSVTGRIKVDSVLQQVAAITIRNAAGYIIHVGINEILDTTLADTLDAFGDVHAQKAKEALLEQRKAVTEEGRRTSRIGGSALLRSAHGEYEKAIVERGNRPVVDKILGKEPKHKLHEKALGVALMMAIIYRDIGELSIAIDWANNARSHFERYASLKGTSDRNTVSRQSMASEVAALESKLHDVKYGDWSWSPFVTREGSAAGPMGSHIGSRSAEIRSLERSIARRRAKGEYTHVAEAQQRLSQLGQEQQQFNQLYARLTVDSAKG
jgi:hypothetical protein